MVWVSTVLMKQMHFQAPFLLPFVMPGTMLIEKDGNIMIIALCMFLGILILSIIGIGWFLMNQVTQPNVKTLEETAAHEREKGWFGQYDSYGREPFIVPCRDGYRLHGELMPCPGSEKYVILSHGFSYSRHGSLKYAWMFLALGYNVLIYDMRNHGENDPAFVSMGWLESRDLYDLIVWAREQYGNDCILGLHGESLGASTSIMALGQKEGLDNPVSFCIADCGYSDLSALLRYQMKCQYPWLPGFLLKVADRLCSIRYGFRFSQVRPIEALAESTVPVFYFHGKDDVFTPPSMSNQMYGASKGKRKIQLTDGAGHAQSYAVDPQGYAEHVRSFLASLC